MLASSQNWTHRIENMGQLGRWALSGWPGTYSGGTILAGVWIILLFVSWTVLVFSTRWRWGDFLFDFSLQSMTLCRYRLLQKVGVRHDNAGQDSYLTLTVVATFLRNSFTLRFLFICISFHITKYRKWFGYTQENYWNLLTNILTNVLDADSSLVDETW